MEINQELINRLFVNNDEIIDKAAKELNIPANKVKNTVGLLKEGNTIPFISRYRKEVIGFIDEANVRDIYHKSTYLENIETRKIEIIKIIFDRGLLTEDLYINIQKASNFSELEDIYSPFKQKKKTRAMIAVEKGLEPLSELMENLSDPEIEKEALNFVDPEKLVNNAEEALGGAMDIIAEKISHDIDARNLIKEFVYNNAVMKVEGLKNADDSVYKMYYDYEEPIKDIKPHRILAINRGEKEEELKVTIDFDLDNSVKILLDKNPPASSYHKRALDDGLKRLLLPSVIRELKGNASETADDHGILVFAKNLYALLMQQPIKKTRLIGIDPGIRTGSKCACLDDTGKFLGYFVIFQHKKEESKKALLEAINNYKAELIAVGSGTGSIEVQQLVGELLKENNLAIQYSVVDEDGASVYSASETAREEFPELDLTIRGAISIGRRLQDPLSELVKIDPKSIGVGLYQHDVNKTKLSSTLDEVVESVVNKVGVNINTASFSILRYVSGISGNVAKNIVRYRDEKGAIRQRTELKNISGIGDKVFEQAAGFLKIPESSNPLDNTWVHPENYEVALEIYKIVKSNGKVLDADKKSLVDNYKVSENLINEIIEELKKPNRDPREDYPKPILKDKIIDFDNLQIGMKVTGKIKNVVDFGAFVDIGIKESALIHVSQISNKFIKNPSEVLKVGDIKEFQIIEIDTVRKRISLSLKSFETGIPVKNNDKPQEKKKKFDYSKYLIKDDELGKL